MIFNSLNTKTNTMKGYSYDVHYGGVKNQWCWTITYKKGTKNENIIGKGSGYNNTTGAKNGLKSACKATGGDWAAIKPLIVVTPKKK